MTAAKKYGIKNVVLDKKIQKKIREANIKKYSADKPFNFNNQDENKIKEENEFKNS